MPHARRRWRPPALLRRTSRHTLVRWHPSLSAISVCDQPSERQDAINPRCFCVKRRGDIADSFGDGCGTTHSTGHTRNVSSPFLPVLRFGLESAAKMIERLRIFGSRQLLQCLEFNNDGPKTSEVSPVADVHPFALVENGKILFPLIRNAPRRKLPLKRLLMHRFQEPAPQLRMYRHGRACDGVCLRVPYFPSTCVHLRNLRMPLFYAVKWSNPRWAASWPSRRTPRHPSSTRPTTVRGMPNSAAKSAQRADASRGSRATASS